MQVYYHVLRTIYYVPPLHLYNFGMHGSVCGSSILYPIESCWLFSWFTANSLYQPLSSKFDADATFQLCKEHTHLYENIIPSQSIYLYKARLIQLLFYAFYKCKRSLYALFAFYYENQNNTTIHFYIGCLHLFEYLFSSVLRVLEENNTTVNYFWNVLAQIMKKKLSFILKK